MKLNLFGVLALSVMLTASANLSCTSTPTESREPASTRRRATGAQPLTNEEIKYASSSGALRLDSARVLIDNDAAFKSKLDAIDAAQSGDTIRLVYYIYSDDHSASLFSSKLLAAAKRGVRVQMMLDFIDNYTYLDLFTYLEEESNQNIQVRLYGKPTPLIARDAYYMTIPCPPISKAPTSTECAADKWKRINQKLAANKDPFALTEDPFTALLLSGLYAKSGGPVKSAFFLGGQIDPVTNPKPSPQQQAELKKLMKLVFQAKVKGETGAYLQLGIATALYGSEINPVLDQVYGRLPFDQMGNPSSKMDWIHISDYTHHKLLLVENKAKGSFFMQLGGRNIQDSYHMKMNPLSKSYTFMDTDFAANVTSGGNEIAAAYDKMWNFSAMTVSLPEIRKMMDNEFVANTLAFGEAVQNCGVRKNTTENERTAMAQCLTESTRASKRYMKLEARLKNQEATMKKNQEIYLTQYAPTIIQNETWKSSHGYKPVSSYDDALTNQDASQSMTTLIENLQFNPKAATPTRLMGVTDGAELQSGKSIHHLLIKGLENTCAIASNGNPKRVIFHTAYWLPPANVIRAFKKMMDGTWNCANVKVTILTNSVQSTDLNPINMMAQYQLKALLQAYAFHQKEQQRGLAQFEYFEYKRPKGVNDEQIRSLHTKLTLLGNDMIIGSANMDVRSYYMDTNNGVFVRNAQDLIAQYSQWIDSITADPEISENLTGLYTSANLTMENLHQKNNQLIDHLKATKKFMKSVKPAQVQQLKNLAQSLGSEVYDLTYHLVSDKPFSHLFQSEYSNPFPRPETIMEKERVEISRKFNELFQVL